MMQHILIPTDFSENAWNAAHYAVHFFANKHVTFHFLHIDISLQAIEDPSLHYSGIQLKKGVAPDAEKRMQQWEYRLNSNFSNPNHTFVFKNTISSFIEGIKYYIHQNNIELVVMGTKGASGMKSVAIGSKSGTVLKQVKCSTLVIPEKARFKKTLHIGFPTDYNMLYKSKVMHTLKKIVDTHKASVHVLQIAQINKPLDAFQKLNIDFLKEQLDGIPHDFNLIDQPSLEEGLQSFINRLDIDMIAMVAKNLNFLQRLLFKPQITKISYYIKTPFLVLHE